MEQQEMKRQPTQAASTSIDPWTHIGLVTLRVADLGRSLSFYEGVLGFRSIARGPGSAVLGAQDGVPLLELREVPGAPPQPRRSSGLYHFAVLLPSRADLGRALLRMAEAGLEIGQSDHLVSEALYISDPDGNGIEIYRDRPRNEWTWSGGTVAMALDPIDLRSLMDDGKSATWDVMPAGTRMGHIHLQVGDIPQAEQFYHGVLGFDITAGMPDALFVSAGGYHHHIGLNTWNSRGAGPAPETAAGLQSFVIALPNPKALDDVRTRLGAHGVPMQEQDGLIDVDDPWRNRIRLAAGE
jgi:catechol 2,3-dioxygenase